MIFSRTGTPRQSLTRKIAQRPLFVATTDCRFGPTALLCRPRLVRQRTYIARVVAVRPRPLRRSTITLRYRTG